ncbi:MAG TPA: quinolinate synthase NadA, partial [bacterium]|nr:quinolinate synthase NadA [bacterium]
RCRAKPGFSFDASMPGKRILPLARSLCPNMFRTSPADLLFTLEEIGKVNEVLVSEEVARDAKVALQRMLSL